MPAVCSRSGGGGACCLERLLRAGPKTRNFPPRSRCARFSKILRSLPPHPTARLRLGCTSAPSWAFASHVPRQSNSPVTGPPYSALPGSFRWSMLSLLGPFQGGRRLSPPQLISLIALAVKAGYVSTPQVCNSSGRWQ